jgi:hypothetical protein
MFFISYSKSIVNYLVFSFICPEQFVAHDLLFHQQNKSPISPAVGPIYFVAAAKGRRYPAKKRSSDQTPIDDMKITSAQIEQQRTMAPKGWPTMAPKNDRLEWLIKSGLHR